MNILYFSPKKRLLRYLVGFTVSILIIAASIATAIAMLIWKKNTDPKDNNKQLLITIVNSVQIIIFSAVYQYLAVFFNNYENHATMRKY